MNFGDLQRNIGKSTVTFRLFNDTGHFSKWNITLYEDFERRFESRQFCRRTTTHGGATTTRGDEIHFKSLLYFPLFIFILIPFLFLYIYFIILLFYFSFVLFYIYSFLFLFILILFFVFSW